MCKVGELITIERAVQKKKSWTNTKNEAKRFRAITILIGKQQEKAIAILEKICLKKYSHLLCINITVCFFYYWPGKGKQIKTQKPNIQIKFRLLPRAEYIHLPVFCIWLNQLPFPDYQPNSFLNFYEIYLIIISL